MNVKKAAWAWEKYWHVNTSAFVSGIACALMRATILGMLCIIKGKKAPSNEL
jgi:hypothetical protein